MNTEKNDFDKYFFKVYEKCSFWKIMENLRKQKDTKLVTTEKKKEFLSIRTKLSQCKDFHRISISNGNEKRADTYK